MPKVSVIVPVYNVAQYLPRCLDSISRQTLKEFEIIAVDDGSTDGSGKILDDYAAREPRLKVIHQTNAGAGAARNAGLDLATGEYLFFFDPDDTASRRMLADMYVRAMKTSADIVVAGKTIVDGRTDRMIAKFGFVKPIWALRQPFSGKDAARHIFTFAKSVPWDKLFRRDFVVREGLRFQKLPRSNDVYFVDMALAIAQRIALVPHAYYRYRLNREGSLQTEKVKCPTAFVESYDKLADDLSDRGLLQIFRPSLARAFIATALMNFRELKGCAGFGECYRAVRAKLEEWNRRGFVTEDDFRDEPHGTEYKTVLSNTTPEPVMALLDKHGVNYGVDTGSGLKSRLKNLVRCVIPLWMRENVKRLTVERATVGTASGCVSVIVPVYNVAPYLPRCLDSLARQTLKEIEIIAVDDGSTDGSGKILDDYAAHEPRLKVIHQANAGAGAARNAGLAVAKGDYLFFCDPDDVCAPEMLERLVARADADGSDVVIAQYYVREANRRRTVNDTRICVWPRKQAVRPDEIADVIFNLTGHTVWDKLFRRAHIESNGLRFQLLPRFNDMLFCDTALVTAKRISFERKPYYEHLVSRADGLQSGKCRDTTTIFSVYDELGAFLRARGLFETYRNSFIAAYVRSGISILRKMLEDADRFGAVWNRMRSELRRICAGNVPARLALSEAHKDFLKCLLSKSSTVEDGCRLARDGGLLRSTARAFAGALLIFPVLTTVFVAAGHLVGIPCSAWHLLAGAVGTLCIVWWKKRRR